MSWFRKMTPLMEWKAAFKRTNKAAEAMKVALQDQGFHSERHLKGNPLTVIQVGKILSTFAIGRPLCDVEGFKVLRDIGLDDCWVAFLGGWVSEYIGCYGDGAKPGKANHDWLADKLSAFLREHCMESIE